MNNPESKSKFTPSLPVSKRKRNILSKNDITDCAFERLGGYCCTKGKKLLINGELKPEKFYFGFDRREALKKKAIVFAEWARMKSEGSAYWTSDAYARLKDAGVVSEKKGLHRLDIAKYNEDRSIVEPLNDQQLAPLLDQNLQLRPDAAVKAMEIDAATVLARLDVRSKFHDQVLKQALTDPWGALERAKRTFDWSGEQAARFLFNVTPNGVQVGGIAFDATRSPANELPAELTEIIEITEKENET